MDSVTGPFDWINSIMEGKIPLEFTDENSKHYTQFLSNRALSMHADTLPYAAEANRFPKEVTDQMHYDLMFHGIRKYKRPRGKWPKATDNPDIVLLCQYYNIGRKTADQYLRIHTKEQLNNIRLHLHEGGDKKPK
jgi:hypothetical protein